MELNHQIKDLQTLSLFFLGSAPSFTQRVTAMTKVFRRLVATAIH
jgi:hypothetical protein